MELLEGSRLNGGFYGFHKSNNISVDVVANCTKDKWAIIAKGNIDAVSDGDRKFVCDGSKYDMSKAAYIVCWRIECYFVWKL